MNAYFSSPIIKSLRPFVKKNNQEAAGFPAAPCAEGLYLLRKDLQSVH